MLSQYHLVLTNSLLCKAVISIYNSDIQLHPSLLKLVSLPCSTSAASGLTLITFELLNVSTMKLIYDITVSHMQLYLFEFKILCANNGYKVFL